MGEEKKKQINDAIDVLRELCRNYTCSECPMHRLNCNGDGWGGLDFPSNWEDIA